MTTEFGVVHQCINLTRGTFKLNLNLKKQMVKHSKTSEVIF